MTRVRPIASEAAVTAVRRGLRTAFWEASLPGIPNTFCSSGRTAPMTGLESSGSSTIMPMSMKKAPAPMDMRPSSPPMDTPSATRPMPRTLMTEPRTLRRTRDFAVAGRWALPMAATGAIRPVRQAGSTAAIVVTRTPMTRAATTVLGAITRSPPGSLAPKVPIRERMATARPTPLIKPTTADTAPTTRASASTERMT